MRVALVLLLLAFVAGSTAAATGYAPSDLGPCERYGAGSGPGTWRWWPFGYDCPPGVGEDVASVAGTLVAVLVALVALTIGWVWRRQVWARGVFAAVLVAGLAGALGMAIGWQGLFASALVGWPLAILVERRLGPSGDRDVARVLLVAGSVACTAAVVAGIFGFGGEWALSAVGLAGAALLGAPAALVGRSLWRALDVEVTA